MDGKTHKRFILAASILPPLVIVAAVVLLWGQLVDWIDLAIFAGMYLACSIGLGVGFHRLFTHRAFETKKPIRYGLAIFGTMGAEGPPIVWVSHHRRHHALADVEGDPHSPHLHGKPGIRGALEGLWHSHWGWLFKENLTSNPLRYAPDLVREPAMRRISQLFLPIVAAGLVLPGLIGLAIRGTPMGFVTGLLWGGVVRMFVLHHVTYSVNSIGHLFGRRRFTTEDMSRNVAWLALPTLGEAWHHNHHAFPRSHTHGLKWYEIDISGMLIRTLERLGLAWSVVRISPEEQISRLALATVAAGAAPAAAPAATFNGGGGGGGDGNGKRPEREDRELAASGQQLTDRPDRR